MANPITWRNVNGPGFGAAAGFMRNAQQGISTGANALQQALDSQATAADTREAEVEADATSQLRDLLSGFGSTQEFEAAQQSGALDQALASFQGVADANVLRNAEDSTLQSLRAAETDEYQYEQTQANRALNPLQDQLNSILVSDGAEAGQQFLDQNSDVFSRANALGSAQQSIRGTRDSAIERADAADARRRRLESQDIEDAGNDLYADAMSFRFTDDAAARDWATQAVAAGNYGPLSGREANEVIDSITNTVAARNSMTPMQQARYEQAERGQRLELDTNLELLAQQEAELDSKYNVMPELNVTDPGQYEESAVSARIIKDEVVGSPKDARIISRDINTSLSEVLKGNQTFGFTEMVDGKPATVQLDHQRITEMFKAQGIVPPKLEDYKGVVLSRLATRFGNTDDGWADMRGTDSSVIRKAAMDEFGHIISSLLNKEAKSIEQTRITNARKNAKKDFTANLGTLAEQIKSGNNGI